MYFLYLLAIGCAVFLNTELASYLGVPMVTTIAFLPMMMFIGLRLCVRESHLNVNLNKEAICVLVLALIICVFKFNLGQNYLKRILEFLVIPMLISICFETLSKRECAWLPLLMLVFFVSECSIAIVERILQRNFFFHDEGSVWNTQVWEFRSTSLLGHALSNAMYVVVFLSFVTVTNFKGYLRIFLFCLGYIALFCFNARGAILIVSGLCGPYFLWKLNKAFPKQRMFLYFCVLCMLGGLFYLVTETSLGGRILHSELMDGSARTRLDVFDFHTFLRNPDDLLWGNPDNYLYVAHRLGAEGVENGVIAAILDYGLIFTPFLLLLLFHFQYRKLSIYSKMDRWFLLAVFYIIATMNPNLVSPLQWTLWIFTYYAFRAEIMLRRCGYKWSFRSFRSLILDKDIR